MLLLACTAPLRAQRVEGIVLDQLSHTPVQAAEVRLLGAKGKVLGRELTGTDGRFAIAIPRFGSYAVEVDALGYTPFRTHVFLADSSQQVSARVDLAPAPIALEGLDVTTTAVARELRRVGFYRGEKLGGFGYFMTEKDVQERALTQITDLFYGLPGVRVACKPEDPTECYAVSTRGALSFTKDLCYLTVVVDGTIVREAWSLPNPEDVVGVEFYPSPAGVPVWARFDSPCGAIIIWTKDH